MTKEEYVKDTKIALDLLRDSVMDIIKNHYEILERNKTGPNILIMNSAMGLGSSCLKLKRSKAVLTDNRLSVEKCEACEGSGMLVALNKYTKAKYHLRCFCSNANKKSSNIPQWNMDYELEYEVL